MLIRNAVLKFHICLLYLFGLHLRSKTLRPIAKKKEKCLICCFCKKTKKGAMILAQTIIDLINPDAKIISDDVRLRPEKSEVERLLGSAAKIKSLTDWKHTIGLNEGLKQTIEWFRNPENSKNYKADIYNV